MENIAHLGAYSTSSYIYVCMYVYVWSKAIANYNLDQLIRLPAHHLAYEIIGFQKIATANSW